MQKWEDFFASVYKFFDEYYQKLQKIADIFGEISLLAGLGWDLCKGILHSQKWLQLEQISRLLENQKKLEQLISLLGRLKESEQFDIDFLFQEKQKNKNQTQISPLARSELYGVHLSNDLMRLLPSELFQLSQPTLKKIFYAKFIENRLLTYELRGLISKKNNVLEKARSEKKKKRKGPIIVCIDTSGSMQGMPERLAKAVTLASVKIALREKRQCYMIAFSGIGNLMELELAQNRNALNNLLEFLIFSFGGGTDFVTPLNRCLELLAENSFSNADILMVTDGIASIPNNFRAKLEEKKKEYNYKIYTILIGNSSWNGIDFSDNIYHLSNITAFSNI